MVKHVVVFKFKPEHRDKLISARDLMLGMQGKIPGLLDIAAGVDFLQTDRSYDLAIVASLADRASLKVYADHPVHQPVKAFLKDLYSHSAAVDFEF